MKQHLNIDIVGYLQQMGSLVLEFTDEAEINNNPFFCPNRHQVQALADAIDLLRREGDSVGARVGVFARGVPVGLGDPVFDKLDATLASAMMSINAVKGVEIGAGFSVVTQRGSEHRDEIAPHGFISNHAGGVLGGISTGQDLEVSIAIKPTSSILTPRDSVDRAGQATQVVTKGRHDPCVGIRATPIAEAMLALVVMEHALQHRAQCGDVQPALHIPG